MNGEGQTHYGRHMSAPIVSRHNHSREFTARDCQSILACRTMDDSPVDRTHSSTLTAPSPELPTIPDCPPLMNSVIMTEADSSTTEPAAIRLQRFLAQCGLGSRRECEELIVDGRVQIDGEVVTKLGTKVSPQSQTVTLDGEKLRIERKKYYLLNKPPGCLCTARDPQGRPTVFDLFPQDGPRLFCVGRLDENTTGLLIVTNDGDLSQKLAHPRYRIHRLYRAQVAGHPDREVFQQLKQGLFFTEGKFQVHDIKPVKKQGQSTWVEITMTEGQNREIRRLLARTGHKVMKLERIGFGSIRLGRVPLGQYRELRRDELAGLFEILDRNRSSSASGSESRRPGNKRRSSEASKETSKRTPAASGSESRRPGNKRRPSGASKDSSKRTPAASGSKTRQPKRKPRRGQRG